MTDLRDLKALRAELLAKSYDNNDIAKVKADRDEARRDRLYLLDRCAAAEAREELADAGRRRFELLLDSARVDLAKAEAERDALKEALVKAAGQESEFHPDWSLLEATRRSLREHMALVKQARADTAAARALMAEEAAQLAGDRSLRGKTLDLPHAIRALAKLDPSLIAIPVETLTKVEEALGKLRDAAAKSAVSVYELRDADAALALLKQAQR